MTPFIINPQNFKTEVLESKKPVLVDFYADWCLPCQMLNPILEELSKKYHQKIKIAKLNIEVGEKIASEYGVMSVPTLIIFQDGQERKRIVGLRRQEELEKILDLF
ncbi:MAG: thioredoxin [Patescibacteria group bacterium]|nr:thioredoxin [Patescibacteria group bacterium]